MTDYGRLAEEAARPKKIRDHSARWEQLQPVASVNGDLQQRVLRFCEAKRISPEALLMLEPRLRVGAGGKVEIAYAGRGPSGAVTAIKYRLLEASSAETRAEALSTWLRPIIAGRAPSDASSWLVAEGETDACRLLGLAPAGTAVLVLPCGAKTFKREWAELIPYGATVYLCHDADEAGDEGAAKAARIIGGSTQRLRPPEGVKDWCEWRGSREAFHELLLHAGTDVPHVQPSDGLTWQRLSEVEMRSIVFVDKPLLQADAFHLFAGRKGIGKGTLLAMIAAGITKGEYGPKRNVVWIASEDSASIDIKPRIVAAGGDPERVLVVKHGWVQLPRDIDEIGRAMSEFGDVEMLVIDPVGNHITGKESNSETDIRDAIAPLNQLADEHECMVFGVRHLTEKEASRGVLAAILGSSAWVQVPRAVIAVVRDDEDPQVSHVQCVAGNRLPPGTPGRLVRIKGVLLPGLENEVTRAAWGGDSTKDVETILSGAGEKEPSKSEAAGELILDILDEEGAQESDALDARVGQEAGIAAKTARNVRGELSNEGLVRSRPEQKPDGTKVWYVSRTNAPRGEPSE